MRYEQQEPTASSGFYRSVSAPQAATRLKLDADGQWRVSADPDPKPSLPRRSRRQADLRPATIGPTARA